MTPREQEVLRLLAIGRTNKEIAHELRRSINTVNNHVQSILRKLGVTNRVEAAGWAIRHGYADSADAPTKPDLL